MSDKHAESKRLYAIDAANWERPWELWEWKPNADPSWHECTEWICFYDECDFRRRANAPNCETKDNINNPSHYTFGGVETIDFIEAKMLGYNLGNVVKYVSRADHKDDALEDLKKARWYLDREIKSHEQNLANEVVIDPVKSDSERLKEVWES